MSSRENNIENKDSKIMDKIRKLLSLGENNKNENEAQAAILKAQELMAEHGINAVTTEDQKISYAEEYCEHRGNREFRKRLSSVIAVNFRCKNYFRGGPVIFSAGAATRKSPERYLSTHTASRIRNRTACWLRRAGKDAPATALSIPTLPASS
jgi:hypothetical protein